MRQYHKLCKRALCGIRKANRTGIDHIGYHDDMCKYHMKNGFPAVTTKKLAVRAVIAEMIGFWRGYDNAEDFRKLGCNVWNANANENEWWVNNPNRKGVDDLGRIYGVQSRFWNKPGGETVDQLKKVYDDLRQAVDNRREIVTHWNPGEMDLMALPPCHLLYQFGIQGDELNLCMYQRSCDVPLGIPFNIAGYAWLLHVMAQITGLKPGTFTHFMHDIHVYENQVEKLLEQIERKPYRLPKLWINPKIKTLEDLDTWVTPNDFHLENYEHQPSIKYPFAV